MPARGATCQQPGRVTASRRVARRSSPPPTARDFLCCEQGGAPSLSSSVGLLRGDESLGKHFMQKPHSAQQHRRHGRILSAQVPPLHTALGPMEGRLLRNPRGIKAREHRLPSPQPHPQSLRCEGGPARGCCRDSRGLQRQHIPGHVQRKPPRDSVPAAICQHPFWFVIPETWLPKPGTLSTHWQEHTEPEARVCAHVCTCVHVHVLACVCPRDGRG